MANRTDFDLQQHMKHSKADLSLFDEETKKKIVPYVVAEPSQGVDRAFLVFMFDAYDKVKDEKGDARVVLRLHPKLAPYKVAILPLVNKLKAEAKELHDSIKLDIPSFYDRSGSIGRRYARADEIGIPFCVTYDFDTKEKDQKVTIRDRDTTEQKRIPVKEVKETIRKLVAGEIEFKDL
jgi:glycyl-tRNA synthetase